MEISTIHGRIINRQYVLAHLIRFRYLSGTRGKGGKVVVTLGQKGRGILFVGLTE